MFIGYKSLNRNFDFAVERIFVQKYKQKRKLFPFYLVFYMLFRTFDLSVEGTSS